MIKFSVYEALQDMLTSGLPLAAMLPAISPRRCLPWPLTHGQHTVRKDGFVVADSSGQHLPMSHANES